MRRRTSRDFGSSVKKIAALSLLFTHSGGIFVELQRGTKMIQHFRAVKSDDLSFGGGFLN